MILRALRARNLLKYAELGLSELPATGQVAVSGANESGKSSVGELLCLALFGHTYALPADEVVRAVKWGEAEGWVEAELAGPDGRGYRVRRHLQIDGQQEASLTGLGESQGAEVRGAEAVTRALEQWLGYGYEGWVDSFYLAQREIVLPHSQGATVKAVAGVDALERVGRELEAEVNAERVAAQQLHGEVAEINTQVRELGFEEQALARLEEARRGKMRAIEDEQRQLQGLADVLEQIGQAGDGLRAAVHGALALTPDQSYGDWCRSADRLSQVLDELDRSCALLETDGLETGGGEQAPGAWQGTATQDAPRHREGLRLAGRLHRLDAALHDHLREFNGLCERAASYRKDLIRSLGRPRDDTESLTERLDRLRGQTGLLEQRRGSARFVAWLFLPVALGLAAVWALLTAFPQTAVAHRISGWIARVYSAWPTDAFQGSSQLLALAGIAAAVVVLDLLFFTRVGALSRRIEDTQDASADTEDRIETMRTRIELLDRLDRRSAREALDNIRGIADPAFIQPFDAFAGSPHNPLLDPRGHRELRDELDAGAAEAEEEIAALQRDIVEQTARMRRQHEQTGKEVGRLDAQIQDERYRRARAGELLGLTRELQRKMAGHQHRIAVRTAARGWAERAARYLAGRFNRDMRAAAGHILPLLTGNRYQYLQIGEDLQPRVFSAQKNDFMDLDEVSSGTQRQITLAVRLALALALAETVVRGPQTLVLDEPFAFFDRERARSTLLSLPRLSPYFAQRWIISQEFDEDIPFDMHIRCSRDSDVLIASGH